MFIKLTLKDGTNIRINFDNVLDYRESLSRKGETDIWQFGETSVITIQEKPDFIDRILGTKNVKSNIVKTELTTETTLESLRYIKIGGRRLFAYVLGYFLYYRKEIKEPKICNLVEILNTSEAHKVRNFGKKSRQNMREYLTENLPDYAS